MVSREGRLVVTVGEIYGNGGLQNLARGEPNFLYSVKGATQFLLDLVHEIVYICI